MEGLSKAQKSKKIASPIIVVNTRIKKLQCKNAGVKKSWEQRYMFMKNRSTKEVKHLNGVIAAMGEESAVEEEPLESLVEEMEAKKAWRTCKDSKLNQHISDLREKVNLSKGSSYEKDTSVNKCFPGAPDNLKVFYGECTNMEPMFLLVGDSITRFAKVPGGVTYCFHGGKALDIHRYIPDIIRCHPSAHTIIVHVGTNDLQRKDEAEVRQDIKAIAKRIEQLGKSCVFSGPIPWYRGSDDQNYLEYFNQWLKDYCSDTHHHFINHFHSFWTRRDLFWRGKLHPTRKGVHVLSRNFIRYLRMSGCMSRM